jgi:ketosteroid isomerase-like protein
MYERVLALAIVLLGSAGAGASAAEPVSAPDAAKEAIRAEIWAKEQMIYAGRSRGDLTPYVANTSRSYVSWPPTVKAPMGYDKLAATKVPPNSNHEQLTMTFMDFALSGDTAVIYYRNHMTRRANGDPVDLTYDVTHTWTREGGVWRVIGGMARLEPVSAP